MPEVGGKKFPYTPEGRLKADKARKELLRSVKLEQLEERVSPGLKIMKNRKTLKKSSNRDAVTKSNPMKMY